MCQLECVCVVKPCTIKKKPKNPKKRGNNTRNQMERPTSKKTKEPPKSANHKENIKFSNPPSP